MNRTVRSWQRSQQRRKDKVPDALTIDGVKIPVGETMPKQRRSTPLSKQHFDNVITMIKEAPLERVLQVRTVTYGALKRLGVKRDASAAVKKNPHGSRQNDTGTLILWINGVSPIPPKPDKDAPDDLKQAYRESTVVLDQLVAIDATLVARGD